MTGSMILHAAVIVIGLYVFASAVQLKYRKKVAKWMSKNVRITENSDIDGFAKNMFGKTIYFGVVVVLFGIYGLSCEVVDTLPKSFGITACFIVLILAYFYILAGAKGKYLGQMK